GGKGREVELELRGGWRKTDVSWRWSLRSVDPPPWVHGEDLSVAEKRALGLGPRSLALRQGPFVSTPARVAGGGEGDVLVAVAGRAREMPARQLEAHVRLTRRVGALIVYNVLRAGKRVDVKLKLVGRGSKGDLP